MKLTMTENLWTTYLCCVTYFTREVVEIKNDTDGRYEASAQELNKKAVNILESIIDEIGE